MVSFFLYRFSVQKKIGTANRYKNLWRHGAIYKPLVPLCTACTAKMRYTYTRGEKKKKSKLTPLPLPKKIFSQIFFSYRNVHLKERYNRYNRYKNDFKYSENKKVKTAQMALRRFNQKSKTVLQKIFSHKVLYRKSVQKIGTEKNGTENLHSCCERVCVKIVKIAEDDCR